MVACPSRSLSTATCLWDGGRTARAVLLLAASLVFAACDGGGACDTTTTDCLAADADGDGFVEGEDCNDRDELVNPGADEVCDDGVDNDCDDLTDGADSDCPA